MILILSDLILISGLLRIMDHNEWHPAVVENLGLAAGTIWIISIILTLQSNQLEKTSALKKSSLHIKQVFLFASLLVFYLIFFEGSQINPSGIAWMSLGFTALGIPRIGIQHLVLSQPGLPSNIVLIGSGSINHSIESYLSKSGNGRVIGVVSDDPSAKIHPDYLGSTEDLESISKNSHFNQLIISPEIQDPKQLKTILAFSENHGIRTSIILGGPNFFNRNFELRDLGGLTIADMREVPLEHYLPRMWKRFFDVIFSISALILLSPILLLIAFSIKLESKGPVFYRAIRIGKNGQPIKVLKFRSMCAEKNPALEKISAKRNDPRVTKVGRILRRYSLDELPQFFNVLEGSMSVVGPRPHRTDLDEKFREVFPSYPVRRFIKPGITGWAQVNGWRGLTETKRDYKARSLHDLWYMEHWSFGLDLLIILFTVFGKKTNQNVF